MGETKFTTGVYVLSVVTGGTDIMPAYPFEEGVFVTKRVYFGIL